MICLQGGMWRLFHLSQKKSAARRNGALLLLLSMLMTQSTFSWRHVKVKRCRETAFVSPFRRSVGVTRHCRGRAQMSANKEDVVKDTLAPIPDKKTIGSPILSKDGLESVLKSRSLQQRMQSGTRRDLFAAGIAGAALRIASPVWADGAVSPEESETNLVWSPRSAILERAKGAGGSNAPQKNTTYGPRFVTYLARFLLNYDQGSRQLWETRLKEIPPDSTARQVTDIRRSQFAAFSGAVEVGLLDYQGPEGARALLSLMRSRYGGDGEEVDKERLKQLALLFSFLTKYQPVPQLQALLGEIDNAGLASFNVIARGNGYTGQAPAVTVSPPQWKGGGGSAVGAAILGETGRLAALKLVNTGCVYCYQSPPEVQISPPPPGPSGQQALGEAILGTDGRLIDVRLTNPGAGYNTAEAPISVSLIGAATEISSINNNSNNSDSIAENLIDKLEKEGSTLEAYLTGLNESNVVQEEPSCGAYPAVDVILDMEVKAVEVISSGSGYAVSAPLLVTIDPPAKCGGDPGGQQAFAIGFLKAGAGARSAAAVLDTRNNDEVEPQEFDDELGRLLPSTVAGSLLFDRDTGLYYAVELEGVLPPPSRYIDPAFGPIGLSPLERESTLGPEAYLRLALSGALCNLLVRVVLHPVDNVKTRVQADPSAADQGILPTFINMTKEPGGQLLRGIDISAVLGFLLGGFGFGCNELFRRQLTDIFNARTAAEVAASSMSVGRDSVVIILLASAGATLVNCLVVCPWEAMRIRVMCSPGVFTPGSFIPAGLGILKEEGFKGFYQGLPTLLFRELPFAIAKFLCFDLVRQNLNEMFPLAQEELATSIAVSLVAGMAAGVAGAIVSNPADVLLTRLGSRGEGDTAKPSWQAVIRSMQEEPGGLRKLGDGLGLRAVFFGSAVALQFFLYDYFKAELNVGQDDLQQVLDVFADRLSFYGALPPGPPG